MKIFYIILTIFSFFFVGGCCEKLGPNTIETDIAGPPVPWTDLNVNNQQGQFQFVIVSDRAGSPRAGVFEDAVNKINLLQPEFVMCIGDLIPGHAETDQGLNREWEEFEGIIKNLEMPFFHIPGNHDVSSDFTLNKWKERFGPTYYHFKYQNVLFLCLNSELFTPDSTGEILNGAELQQEQMAYIHKVLEENRDVRWTLVFLHKPVWTYGPDIHPDWLKVEDMLGDRPYTVFCGHTHDYVMDIRKGRKYFILATTGGKSKLRGKNFGEFDHIVWVTMKKQGPIIANLMLDGISDENIRTRQMADFINTVSLNPVTNEPILLEGENFTDCIVRFRLDNTADRPMHVKGQFAKHPDITPEEANIYRMVKANSSQYLNVKLRSAEPKKFEELSPVFVDWIIRYDHPDGTSTNIQTQSAVIPEKRYSCCPKTQDISIDGSLEEWGQLSFPCDTSTQLRNNTRAYKGPTDCSFRFGVCYDDEYLYIAVQVKDDESYLDPNKTSWAQDGVEVRVDPRDDPERTDTPVTSKNRTKILTVLMSSAPSANESKIYNEKNAPKGTKAVCVKTDTGYNAEIAIPAARLNKIQGKEWQAFRLNVTVNDFDSENNGVRIWWRPDWRTELTFPGSGTFLRK